MRADLLLIGLFQLTHIYTYGKQIAQFHMVNIRDADAMATAGTRFDDASSVIYIIYNQYDGYWCACDAKWGHQ